MFKSKNKKDCAKKSLKNLFLEKSIVKQREIQILSTSRIDSEILIDLPSNKVTKTITKIESTPIQSTSQNEQIPDSFPNNVDMQNKTNFTSKKRTVQEEHELADENSKLKNVIRGLATNVAKIQITAQLWDRFVETHTNTFGETIFNFPINSEEQFQELEDRMKDKEFYGQMVNYLKQLKLPTSLDFNIIIKELFTNKFLSSSNYDGTYGPYGKAKFKNNKIELAMKDAWLNSEQQNWLKSLPKAIKTCSPQRPRSLLKILNVYNVF